MKSKANGAIVNAAALIVFLIGATTLILVLERLSAALWQLYKFDEYGGGHINLSPVTGLVFVIATISLLAASLFLRSFSIKSQLHFAARTSLTASFFAVGSLLLYGAIALSPLSVWRA